MLEDRLTASGLVLSRSFLNRLAVDVLAIAQEDEAKKWETAFETMQESGQLEGWSLRKIPPGTHGEGWQTHRDMSDATSVTDIFEHPAAGPVYASGGYISQSQVYDKAMNGPNVPDPPLKPGEVRAWKNQDDELLREILEAFPDAEVVGIGVRGKSAYSWWLVLRGRGDT
jgi:hypothetical protein